MFELNKWQRFMERLIARKKSIKNNWWIIDYDINKGLTSYNFYGCHLTIYYGFKYLFTFER